jgi:hypothetical protein
MDPLPTLAAFDAFLTERHLRFTGIVIGGTALALLGVKVRPTRDCDILSPAIPSAVAEQARAFATHRRKLGDSLQDDWLNNGPESLARVLPENWESRIVPAFDGRSIRLQTLGRTDLICSKVFALCDRAVDLQDCIALAPTKDELITLAPWLDSQDLNPDWPQHTRSVLSDLKRRLGHGA